MEAKRQQTLKCTNFMFSIDSFKDVYLIEGPEALKSNRFFLP